jgi:hypothetical protein
MTFGEEGAGARLRKKVEVFDAYVDAGGNF